MKTRTMNELAAVAPCRGLGRFPAGFVDAVASAPYSSRVDLKPIPRVARGNLVDIPRRSASRCRAVIVPDGALSTCAQSPGPCGSEGSGHAVRAHGALGLCWLYHTDTGSTS